MFSFLKSLKLPFNQKIVQCLSIIVIVLLVLYFTGFINTDKLPFETYEEAEDEYPESEYQTEENETEKIMSLSLITISDDLKKPASRANIGSIVFKDQ